MFRSVAEAKNRSAVGEFSCEKEMSMSDTQGMIHEDALPGHESGLDPRPEWQPRYKGSDRLAGKVAIITGADSGIGRAVAALYAREGADIAIAYLCEDDDAAETKRIVEAEGRKAITIRGDIGEKETSERIVAETLSAFGKIDILVNNAGEQHPDKDITDITEEQLRRTFQTNIFGMFFLVQAARPHLQEGAAIINCTSVTMYQGSKELLDYSSTKGAITAFTARCPRTSSATAYASTRWRRDRSGPRSTLRRRQPGEARAFWREHPDGSARTAQRGRPAFLSSPARTRATCRGKSCIPMAARS
jgi:NAD(P)-dependent dehydrogenase (short-subunit alcohol dehydrogenase family)